MPSGGSYPVYFPGNGSSEPLTSYSGYEFPDPLTACSGYSMPTGLPVFVQVGGNVTTSVSAHAFIGNGTALPHCVIDGNNPTLGSDLHARGGVIVIPRSPLQVGVTYTVALTVNGLPYTWSFNVSSGSAMVPGAPLNVGAIAGDTTATVTWSAPSYTGGTAIASYTVTPHVGSTAGTPQVVTAPTGATCKRIQANAFAQHGCSLIARAGCCPCLNFIPNQALIGLVQRVHVLDQVA